MSSGVRKAAVFFNKIKLISRTGRFVADFKQGWAVGLVKIALTFKGC